MAKDTLVTGDFSDAMRDAGALLLQSLDGDAAGVRSAFWMYFPDLKTWKFIIASEKVDMEGPREFYKRVIKANRNAKAHEYIISLNDIGVSNLKNPIVILIGFVIGTPENAIAGIRFSRSTINGTFIEDAYIYRSSVQAEAGPVN